MSSALVVLPQGFGSNLPAFSDQASVVIKRLFGNKSALLEKGLTLLTESPGYEAWAGERQQDIQNIFKDAQGSLRLQNGIEQQARNIADANHIVQNANRQQKDLEGQLKEAREIFQKRGAEFEDQLQAIQEKVRREGTIALWSFNNPLVSRIGRLMANFGFWKRSATAVAATAVVAGLHKAALVQSCSGLSLQVAAQCVSAVATPSLLVPLVVVAGVFKLSSWVQRVAQKIFKHKEKEAKLTADIQKFQESHFNLIEEVEKEKLQCSEQIQKSSSSIEAAQKETEALEKEKSEHDRALKTIHDRLADDTINQAIGQIETGLGLAADNPALAVVRHQLTVPSMKTIMNTLIGQMANHAGMPKAVAAPSPALAVAGPDAD